MQAVLDDMASSGITAAAPDQATQPVGAYADAVVMLLTCTQASAREVSDIASNIESFHLTISQFVRAKGNPTASLHAYKLHISSSVQSLEHLQPHSLASHCAIDLVVQWPVQLLERGRQAARHVKNAQHAVQQVQKMTATEHREKLKPSALAALEGRELELKVRLSPGERKRLEVLLHAHICGAGHGIAGERQSNAPRQCFFLWLRDV